MASEPHAHSYRPDIDGLRAIAVGLVVLFHCGFAARVPGGFVGVDIFFVISGYLITGLIYRDAVARRFSILDFYHRRARRIFPALFVVYAAILAAAFALLMPNETLDLSKETISSALFVSNVYFYFTSNYFDVASSYNAVLHTWSLSVEEQFYIAFPLLVIAIRGLDERQRKIALAGMAVASLALSQYMVATNATGAFYLVQSRAWELLTGSLLAVGAIPQIRSAALAQGLGLLGLGLIGASALLLTETSPFPGVTALPSCLGAALVIHSGAAARTAVARLLSLPPVRFVGLVSYSLYLWHWPVWVFGGLIHDTQSPTIKLSYIAISFALAVLSWRFVERPFRTQPYRLSPAGALRVAVASFAGVIAASLALNPAASAYWNIPESVEKVASFVRYDPNPSFRTGSCFLTSEYNQFSMFDRQKCLGVAADRPNYLLIGDSHAAHLYPGLKAALPNVNVLQATASGCKPVSGTTGERRCVDLVNFAFDDFLPRHHVDAVILSANWKAKDLDALERAVERLKPYADTVYVFGPIVEYDVALPRLLAKAMYSGDDSVLDDSRVAATASLDKTFAARLTAKGAKYVSVYDAICPNGRCTLWGPDGHPVQFDYGHLTASGSELIVSRVFAALKAGPRASADTSLSGDRGVAE